MLNFPDDHNVFALTRFAENTVLSGRDEQNPEVLINDLKGKVLRGQDTT